MSFPKNTSNSDGKSKTFGNVVPADENSNKGPASGSQSIGTIKGRLTFSKSSVASLNTGVSPYRDDGIIQK